MSGEPPLELLLCPECGASNTRQARACWLCARPVDAQAPAAGSPFADQRRPDDRGAWTFGVSALVLVVTLAALGVGIWQIEPGWAVIYAVAVTPPLVATFVTSLRRQAEGRPLTALQKLGAFALSAGVMLAAIPLLIVAVGVALFIFCMALMAAGN